jgi:hypothetical protein
VGDRRLLARMTSTPAMAIERQIRTMNHKARSSVPSVGEPQANPGHGVGASAAPIARSSDAASSSMIDATVANSDPVPSRAEPASPRSASPPNRSEAASNVLRGTSPVGVSPSPGVPPEGPGGVGLVPGGDEGVGSGAGEAVWVGDGVGSGLGDGEGSGDGGGEGSSEGEGVGEGEGFFAGSAAIAPDDTALRVHTIAQRAMSLAACTRLLRRPLDPPAT